MFLFGSLDVDADRLAARFGRALELRVPNAPPIELRGPVVKTVVLFEPISRLEDPQLPRMLAGYDVRPLQWGPSQTLQHHVCLNDAQSDVPLWLIFTKLTHPDGSTDTDTVEIQSRQRVPCRLPEHARYKAIEIEQRTRSARYWPLVIASAYVVNRQKQPSNVIAIPLDSR